MKTNPIDEEQLRKFEIAVHENLKGIDDYLKFKGSKDDIERTVAWINQLSPWNLERGIEHLRSVISKAELEGASNLHKAIVKGAQKRQEPLIDIGYVNTEFRKIYRELSNNRKGEL